jgi:hypothetical protein
MKFGDVDLKNCNQCPAYEWAGESISRGDCGYNCGFGAFRGSHAEKKQIPRSCPIRQTRELVRFLAETCEKESKDKNKEKGNE